MNKEEIFKSVLDGSFRVHTALGPGLLESAYEECLYWEIRKQGLQVDRQKQLSIVYHELILENVFRIDLLVEKQIIVEIKSVEGLGKIHMAQIITYLKLSGCQLGLLVNFNVSSLKDGIKRIVYSKHQR